MLVQQIPGRQPTFSFDSIGRLYHATKPVTLRHDDRYVVFADLHMGDGSKADDFLVNADLFARVLRDYYLDENYSLILNGDVEELQRFPLDAVRGRWSEIFRIFHRFDRVGRFHKLVGNHDISLVDTRGDEFPVAEAMRFRFNGDNIFIFHGHQVSSGCVIGKSGVTALEIADGEIRLVYWFDRNRSTRYLGDLNVTPRQLGPSDVYRAVVQGDRLDYVLSRIRLLT